MKRLITFASVLMFMLSSCIISMPAAHAATVAPIIDGAGWALDFSQAADDDTVPFDTTYISTAEFSGGALQVTPSALYPRLVYNGGDFSVDASEIKKIIITYRTAVGDYFRPYLYFGTGGGFVNDQCYRSVGIPGTGDWREVVINTTSNTMTVDGTSCTGTLSPNLNWSGTITQFRLDNTYNTSDTVNYEIRSIRFIKAPVDGETVNTNDPTHYDSYTGWKLDFSGAEDGALPAGTIRNAAAAVSDGALVFNPTGRDPGITSLGTSFSVNAAQITEIRIKLKLPDNASNLQLFYGYTTAPAGNELKDFGMPHISELSDLDDGWKEYIVDTDQYSDWTGTIRYFRFDVDTAGKIVHQYQVQSIEFVPRPGYVIGVKRGKEWTMDFSAADDYATPVINAHRDDNINTNATYEVSGNALHVNYIDSNTTTRVAVSNRSNFSVKADKITKIVFRVRTSGNVSRSRLYFASESGSFGSYLTAVRGTPDSDGWRDFVFDSSEDANWNAITDDITKFRFDVTFSSAANYEVQSIKFLHVPIYQVELDSIGLYKNNNPVLTVADGTGTVTARAVVQPLDNATNPPTEGTLIIGTYSGERMRTVIIGSPVTLQAGETTITATGTLPVDSSVTEIRLFLVDNTDNLSPLCNYYAITE